MKKVKSASVLLVSFLAAGLLFLCCTQENGGGAEPETTTPNASIDYVNETLTGLTANANYTVNSTAKTADASGTIAIDSGWLDTTVSIVKKGTATDSAAQSLAIPARPGAPAVSGGTGEITGADATMAYSADRTSWTAYRAPVAAGIYYVRVKPTKSNFAGTASRAVTVSGYIIDNKSSPDLKKKFGVSTASDAFANLHLLISAPQGTDDFTTIIALGDYIDLPSLTIEGSGTINDAPITGGSGRGNRLRLIVVGINSFKYDGTGVGTNANNSSVPDHVVFQFQNVPVLHDMNSSATNVGGYAGSAMKTYLMGAFLTGLKTATGLTDETLWAPERKVTVDTITDALWLPTEWEMFGARTNPSAKYETGANQARLEYYAAGSGGNTRHIKYASSNTNAWYWLASPDSASSTDFCIVQNGGDANVTSASVAGGCAPAFCVR